MTTEEPKPTKRTTAPRVQKAVLTDARGVAEMLDCGLDAVWRGKAEGRMPAPLTFSGEERWRIAEIRAWVVAGCPDRETWERRTAKPKPPPERKPKSKPAMATQAMLPKLAYDNFAIPRPGKSVFAWAREMEKVFGTALVAGMGRDGESLGCSDRFAEWKESQVQEICMRAIGFLRTLPTYRGQFDHLIPGGPPESP